MSRTESPSKTLYVSWRSAVALRENDAHSTELATELATELTTGLATKDFEVGTTIVEFRAVRRARTRGA